MGDSVEYEVFSAQKSVSNRLLCLLTGIPFLGSLCDVKRSFFLEFFLDKQIWLG